MTNLEKWDRLVREAYRARRPVEREAWYPEFARWAISKEGIKALHDSEVARAMREEEKQRSLKS